MKKRRIFNTKHIGPVLIEFSGSGFGGGGGGGDKKEKVDGPYILKLCNQFSSHVCLQININLYHLFFHIFIIKYTNLIHIFVSRKRFSCF